jgi:DNA mismatch repair protein MutS
MYVRKQTLANAERYITEELKIMEDKILGAEEKLINLEYSLFTDIRDSIEKEIARLKKSARIISNLDGISTLALIALENDYVKPEINEDGIIEIVDGRHPVVEKVIGRGEFVSNNTTLNQSDKELLLITGPNMAGKSTYMRQVALITLMAQIGSFVPASSANISICDKIFTRIGASDDLAGGKSTFMVEMWEVSNILKNATSKSLVLLDEVGRGTSTYDGLSIAWSVIEYITGNENLRCKTLFATHYHELVKLEGVLPGVKNYSVAVKKMKDSVIFLRKIVEGGADESYGIEVAKLAGLPDDVINRAKEILLGLEGENNFDIHKVTNTEIIENEVAVDINQANNVVTITEKACESKSEYIEKVEAKDSFDKAKSNKDDHRIDEKTENSSKKHKNKDSSNNMQLDFTFIEKEAFLKEVSEVDILSLNPMEAMNTLYRLVAEAKKLK